MKQKQCERCGQWHDIFNLEMSICKKCHFEIKEARRRKQLDEESKLEVHRLHELEKSRIDFKKLILWLENSDSQGRFEKFIEILGSDEIMQSALADLESAIPADWLSSNAAGYLSLRERFNDINGSVSELQELLADSENTREELIHNLMNRESFFTKLTGSKRRQINAEYESLCLGYQSSVDMMIDKLSCLDEIIEPGSIAQEKLETAYRNKIKEILVNTDVAIMAIRKKVEEYQKNELPNKLWVSKNWWEDKNGGEQVIKSSLLAYIDDVVVGEDLFNITFSKDIYLEADESDIYQKAYIQTYLGDMSRIYAKFKISADKMIELADSDEFPIDPRPKDHANVFWDACYPLRCLTTDKIIKPSSEGQYHLHYASNENPDPKEVDLSIEDLKGFTFYKFISKSEALKWKKAKI